MHPGSVSELVNPRTGDESAVKLQPGQTKALRTPNSYQLGGTSLRSSVP
jgi:hypothetical protein